jgi:hypothetical protein
MPQMWQQTGSAGRLHSSIKWERMWHWVHYLKVMKHVLKLGFTLALNIYTGLHIILISLHIRSERRMEKVPVLVLPMVSVALDHLGGLMIWHCLYRILCASSSLSSSEVGSWPSFFR